MQEQPINCILHGKELEEMKAIMLDVRDQLTELKSMTGPLAAHERILGDVVASDRRAHDRITQLQIDFKELTRSQNRLIVKLFSAVIGLLTIFGGAVAVWVK